MPQEIERKFLVDHERWQQSDKPQGQLYRQGYLQMDPTRTIRVRLTPEKAFLTIKGLNDGATRAEYEYESPRDDAQELLDKFSVAELSKLRYKVDFEGKTWEVDEFLGDNQGLIVAEIELNSEAETFALPDWVGREVTEDARYYNVNLTVAPFKAWKD